MDDLSAWRSRGIILSFRCPTCQSLWQAHFLLLWMQTSLFLVSSELQPFIAAPLLSLWKCLRVPTSNMSYKFMIGRGRPWNKEIRPEFNLVIFFLHDGGRAGVLEHLFKRFLTYISWKVIEYTFNLICFLFSL